MSNVLLIVDNNLLIAVILFRNSVTVALKIIRNVSKYRDAAKLEINVLEKVNRIESNGDK